MKQFCLVFSSQRVYGAGQLMKKICLFIWLLLLMACGTEGTEKAFVAQQATSDLDKAIHEKINALPDGFESCRPGFTAKNLEDFSQAQLNKLLLDPALVPPDSPTERYLPQVQPEPCQIQQDTIEEIFFFALMHPDISPELLAIQAQKHPTLKNENILTSSILVPCFLVVQRQRFLHGESLEQMLSMKIYADIRLKDQRQYRTQPANIQYLPLACLKHHAPIEKIYTSDISCKEKFDKYGSCGIGAETLAEICRTSANPPFTCPEFLRQEYFEKNKAANEGS